MFIGYNNLGHKKLILYVLILKYYYLIKISIKLNFSAPKSFVMVVINFQKDYYFSVVKK